MRRTVCWPLHKRRSYLFSTCATFAFRGPLSQCRCQCSLCLVHLGLFRAVAASLRRCPLGSLCSINSVRVCCPLTCSAAACCSEPCCWCCCCCCCSPCLRPIQKPTAAPHANTAVPHTTAMPLFLSSGNRDSQLIVEGWQGGVWLCFFFWSRFHFGIFLVSFRVAVDCGVTKQNLTPSLERQCAHSLTCCGGHKGASHTGLIIFIYRNTSHCYHELWNTQCIDQQCRHTQRYQPTNQDCNQHHSPFTHFDCLMLTAPFGGKVGIKTTFGRVANRRRHHQRTSPRCVTRRDDVRTATEQA